MTPVRLFEAGYRAIGLDSDPPLPLNPSRAIGSSLVLAKEWGIDDLVDRLARAIDASYEPTWDTERGEFTWGLRLDEPHPRGQFNAFLAAGEAAGPGMWTRLSEAPLEPCPQIVGVDFPTMAFTRAEWVDGNLRLRLAPLHEDPTKRTELPDPRCRTAQLGRARHGRRQSRPVEHGARRSGAADRRRPRADPQQLLSAPADGEAGVVVETDRHDL